jgi:hypothetical protein
MAYAAYRREVRIFADAFNERQKRIGTPIHVVQGAAIQLEPEGEREKLPPLILEGLLYGREVVAGEGIIIIEPGSYQILCGSIARHLYYIRNFLIGRDAAYVDGLEDGAIFSYSLSDPCWGGSIEKYEPCKCDAGLSFDGG